MEVLTVWQDALRVSAIVVVGYFLLMWAAAVGWTLQDIKHRTRRTAVRAAAVATVTVFSLPGLVLYLILRPRDTLEEAYSRQLETSAMLTEIQMATCPVCRRSIRDEFVACPYCRTDLKTPCQSCQRPLAFKWTICPYCGDGRAATAVAADASPATARGPGGVVERRRVTRAPTSSRLSENGRSH